MKGLQGERNSMVNQTEYIFAHLNDPTLVGKKLTINAFDSYLYKIHLVRPRRTDRPARFRTLCATTTPSTTIPSSGK